MREIAVSGDYLRGEVEFDIFTSVGQSLNPLKTKVERVIIDDSLLIALNDVSLDKDTRSSFKRTIQSFETTVSSMNKTLSSLNRLVDSSNSSLNITLDNTQKVTENFVKVSDTLVNAILGRPLKTLEATLDNVNKLIKWYQRRQWNFWKTHAERLAL